MVHVSDPVTVVGDIHGQFYDLLKALEKGGAVGETKYLFLGDYVDRGGFSVEVVLLLAAMKIAHPDSLFMLRGNHECRLLTQTFTFKSECVRKHGQDAYTAFMDFFDTLPLAAVVNGKHLALHGGISPELLTLEDLNRVNRFVEPPKSGLLVDVLWADPVDCESGALSAPFVENEQRGCSFKFGAEALGLFLSRNKLASCIRAHEVQVDGYKMFKWKSKSFPQVITVFSAPNYCGSYGNKAAVIMFKVG